jgi:hypothetical protein
MIGVGGGALYAIAFMAAGVFLTVAFFVAAALIVVGHFKPSRGLRRAGWITLAIWLLPAAAWSYYLQILTEKDQYRTLAKAEVVYGVPLPAGAQVNYHRWARRVQWAFFRTPQEIRGVEYAGQVNFCGSRVCSGTLARDQEIQGIPCRAQTDVHYSETTGQLTSFTLSRSFARDGVTWPAGTAVNIASSTVTGSYQLPQGAEPVRVQGLLVHSGLMLLLAPDGRITTFRRDQTQLNADTRLEADGITIRCDRYDGCHLEPDGTIQGGTLAGDATIDGQRMKAGERVVIPKDAH